MKKLVIFLVILIGGTAFIFINTDIAKAKKPPYHRKSIIRVCMDHPEWCDRVIGRLCLLLDSVGYDSESCADPDGDQCPVPDPQPDPDPDPDPQPSLDHLIISEVYYDVDEVHGTESANEWVEIYNGTGSSVDLGSWKLVDNLAEDLIPEGMILEDQSFAIITRDDTTAPFWSIPAETLMIEIGSQIGNGLGNSGDVLYLKDATDTTVDSLSWGSNVDVFDPSVPDVIEDHSIARTDLTTDTDTASDWVDLETPTPGS